MRAVARGATLVLLLTGACDDEIDGSIIEAGPVDAASRDAGVDGSLLDASLWGCQQADEELGKRLTATDPTIKAELTHCTRDEDCTSWRPVFRCEDRLVRLSQCVAPIAATKAEAAERWLDGFERDLCPHIAPNCIGTGDCLGGEPRCVQQRCALVHDGGV